MRADYLIAADGHRSPIREALGIGRSGHGASAGRAQRAVPRSARGVSRIGDQPVRARPARADGLLTTYRDGRWLLMFSDDEERDEATLTAMVVAGDRPLDLEIELITTGRWELSALIADRFSSGGCSSPGTPRTRCRPRAVATARTPASRTLTISRGSSRRSSRARRRRQLLDTYDAERRPIAWLRHDQIFARQDYAEWATRREKAVAIIDDDAMELGQLYRSNAVLGAATSCRRRCARAMGGSARHARAAPLGLEGGRPALDARSVAARLGAGGRGRAVVSRRGAGQRASGHPACLIGGAVGGRHLFSPRDGRGAR